VSTTKDYDVAAAAMVEASQAEQKLAELMGRLGAY